MENKLRIVIIDDDPMVSLSLTTILEAAGNIKVVATGSDGSQALSLYKENMPDVLLTDIRMKDVTGLEAAADVLGEYPDAKLLLLTTFNDDEYIIKALSLGVKGYILKQDFAAIAPAVIAVSSGQTVFGGEVMEKIPRLMESKNGSSDSDSNESKNGSSNGANGSGKSEAGNVCNLQEIFEECDINEKEISIIKLIAEGLNNKEIADKLFLSEGTVRNYLSTILEKLELRDRTQLAVFYLRGKM